MRLPRILEFSDEESVTTRFLGVNYSDASSEEELTDADVAKIMEIVTGETGYTASQIKIIPTAE